ncbi:MAG: hypothetical protein JF597_03530 [Streptomyces sp.]|uniref:hypothetical protein n=1 Tax=Streptomyces sp. TaxID=1931 RepID=UPI0025E6AACD|nr:hypothetical protein [Streptomyces sp.]MBW8792675.1 hypothetical protein [Streptomyces sp.]
MDGRDDFHGPEAPQEDVKDTAVGYDGPLDPTVSAGTGALAASNVAEINSPNFSEGNGHGVSVPSAHEFDLLIQHFLDCGRLLDDSHNTLVAALNAAAGGWPTAAATGLLLTKHRDAHAATTGKARDLMGSLAQTAIPATRDKYAHTGESTEVTAAQIQDLLAPSVAQIQGINSSAEESGGKSDA